MAIKKSSYIIGFLCLLIIVVSISFVIASRTLAHPNIVLGHGGDEVLVSYNGGQRNLDEVLTDMVTRNAELGTTASTPIIPPPQPIPESAPVCGNGIVEGNEMCDSDSYFDYDYDGRCQYGGQIEYICNTDCSGYEQDPYGGCY